MRNVPIASPSRSPSSSAARPRTTRRTRARPTVTAFPNSCVGGQRLRSSPEPTAPRCCAECRRPSPRVNWVLPRDPRRGGSATRMARKVPATAPRKCDRRRTGRRAELLGTSPRPGPDEPTNVRSSALDAPSAKSHPGAGAGSRSSRSGYATATPKTEPWCRNQAGVVCVRLWGGNSLYAARRTAGPESWQGPFVVSSDHACFQRSLALDAVGDGVGLFNTGTDTRRLDAAVLDVTPPLIDMLRADNCASRETDPDHAGRPRWVVAGDGGRVAVGDGARAQRLLRDLRRGATGNGSGRTRSSARRPRRRDDDRAANTWNANKVRDGLPAPGSICGVAK